MPRRRDAADPEELADDLVRYRSLANRNRTLQFCRGCRRENRVLLQGMVWDGKVKGTCDGCQRVRRGTA